MQSSFRLPAVIPEYSTAKQLSTFFLTKSWNRFSIGSMKKTVDVEKPLWRSVRQFCKVNKIFVSKFVNDAIKAYLEGKAA
jgi:hypothetical protein